MRKLVKRLRSENGQAIVELAFVLPIVLLFLFGIIDFGIALNNQNEDTNIANIAVREAAVVGTTTYAMCGTTTENTLAAWAVCENSTMGGPPLTNFCVYDTATSTTGTTYTTGDPVQVRVQSNFSWLRIVSSNVKSLSSTIGANATMRVEGTITGTNPFFSNSGYTC